MIVLGFCTVEDGRQIERNVLPRFSSMQTTLPEGSTEWWIWGSPGQRWSCELVRVKESGGHKHAKGPVGTLKPKSGKIPEGGVFKGVMHKTPAASGDIELKYTIGQVTGSVFSRAMVPNLVELPISTAIERVGVTTTHPQSHYGLPAMTSAVTALAKAFHKKFSKPLGVNDMSLPWGGLFDWKATWAKPHKTHRTGVDVDIRTRFMSKAEKDFLVKTAKEMKFKVLEESDPPHHHLTLQATKTLLLAFDRPTSRRRSVRNPSPRTR